MKRFLLTMVFTGVLAIGPMLTSLQAQRYLRGSVGLGTRQAFGTVESRGAALMFTGELGRVFPWLGTGGAFAYSNLNYTFESLPAIFIGTSSSVYIDQFLLEFMELDKLPLGGVVSPYLNVLLGLNLGAGFSQNQFIPTGRGLSLAAIYLAAGVEFMPVKNLGVHFQVGGPIAPVNFGLSVRWGQGLAHKSLASIIKNE